MITIHKASAGSGKTYSLALEYIKLLLGYKGEDGRYHLRKIFREEHSHILAITFTNKATEEMKTRIIDELHILSNRPSESNYKDTLIGEYGCSVEELSSAADIALKQLLFNEHTFNVSTIDSFFQNIIRTFAYEIELDGNFEIDMDDAYSISMGVHQLLSSINFDESERSKKLSDWIRQYMISQLENGNGFNLFNRRSVVLLSIVTFIRVMCDEHFKSKSDELFDYLNNPSRDLLMEFDSALKNIMDACKNTLRSIASQATSLLDRITSQGIEADLNSYILNDIRKITRLNRKLEITATSEAFIAGDKSLFKSKKPVITEIEEAARDILASVGQVSMQERFARKIKDNVFILRLIGDVLNHIESYTKDNNLVRISDTTDLLKRIISADDLPFIYEKYGVTLHHFLIDEFQDTSQLQWENLLPMLKESVSRGYDNLIIGDEKQCIYRFRNSDPRLLREEVEKEFEGYTRIKGNLPEENTNYRSSAVIVDFNNRLFASLAGKLGVEKDYDHVIQSIRHKEKPGYVRINRFADKSSFEQDSLDLLLVDIKRQLLVSKYEPRDIAVLVRTGKECKTVVNHLLNNLNRALNEDNTGEKLLHVDVVSDEALSITNSPAVRLIINIIRYIGDFEENNEADLRKTFNHRISCILYMYEKYIREGYTPGDALKEAVKNKDNDPIAEFARRFHSQRCDNLPSLIECIIEQFVTEEARQSETIFLMALQDAVMEFCARGACDVQSFIRWWDKSGCELSVTTPSDMNAIRVMTIHKSKGLQFGCVHIPFAGWPVVKDRENEWYDGVSLLGIDQSIVPPILPVAPDKFLEKTELGEQYLAKRKEKVSDMLNATYVAFTRAEKEMIINYQFSKSAEKDPPLTGINHYIYVAGKEIFTDKFSDGNITIGNVTEAEPGRYEKDKDEIPVEKREGYFTLARPELFDSIAIEEVIDPDEAKDEGVILHDIMRKVYRRNNVELAVRRKAYRLRLDAEHTDRYIALLTEAVNRDDERIARWFSGFKYVMTERTILTDQNEKYRPDRVVFNTDGSVDVVDYKFGKEKSKKYHRQIRDYVDLIRKAGHGDVRGYLWYVTLDEIEEIKLNK